MANVIDYVLDVLATSPEEINRIEARLKQPSSDLLNWVAEKWNTRQDELLSSLTELVSFTPTKNLFAVDNSVNRSRRFENAFKRYTGIVNSHILEVSEEFPAAIFLLEHFDMQFSYSGKMVIHAGQVVQEVFDGKQRAQAIDWTLLDIFAPFKAEWDTGLPFGSLWNEWIAEMLIAVEDLRKSPEQLEAEQSARPN